ncbi:cupin [Halobacillus shinanisalinarum]|uniref:Cupin n=1 Tax=Halobacillus shinanisalinarum TaxID=2932258 RepID=A0ABY4GTW4_9BACI|nr:cupin [Halobacillus shinanisalinarum]UOQ91459.1 cupin [Halobacillus shinanisalinarum]
MEIYQFKKETGKKIKQFNSDFIMSRITQTQKAAHIGCMHLDKNGIIGYHQAVVPQLLLIVSGEGLVRGETDEFVKVHSGEAVFWDKDEWHETTTDTGLTAIVIESEELITSSLMPL